MIRTEQKFNNGVLTHSPDAFRYIWWIWRIMGMQPIKKYPRLYAIYAYIFVGVFISFLAPISLFGSVLAQSNIDLKLILAGFAINMTFLTTSLKQYLIWFFKDHLIEAEHILKKLDERLRTAAERDYLNGIVHFCHIMYFFYSVVFYSALSAFLVSPLFSPVRKLPFEAWFPFDYMEMYYGWAYLYEIVASTLLAAQNLSNDIYPPCYILILTAQMHLLNQRISKIGDKDWEEIPFNVTKKSEENLKKLFECIKDHKDILICYKEIGSVISNTMLVTFLVTAFIICVTGVNLLVFEATVVEAVTAIIYLMVILCESFPCCFLANRMSEEFELLTNAIYRCNWMDQSTIFRKCVIIFMQRSQQSEKFKAGNLFPISLDTLLGIMKFSFSMFSLLSQIK